MKFILLVLVLSLILGGLGFARFTSRGELSLSAESLRQERAESLRQERARDESQASLGFSTLLEKLSSSSLAEQQEFNKAALSTLKQEFKSYANLSSVNF